MLRQIARYSGRGIIFVRFIRGYWLRQLIFDARVFRAIVVEGYDLASIKVIDHDDELVPVNRYHTRYEGTTRAAA